MMNLSDEVFVKKQWRYKKSNNKGELRKEK